MKINIAFGISIDWCKYASVTAASVLSNADDNDEYVFYVLSSGITEEHKNIFYRLNKIKKADYVFIEMDNDYFEGAIHDHLGISASYRLCLSSITDLDKVLYLDSDIIAMKNIAELYAIDVSDYYLAAVVDKGHSTMKSRCKLGKDDIFFNSGMQLINLKKFRENNIEAKFFEKLREVLYYTDQDVLNDICRGKILPLHIKYNVMQSNGYVGFKEE